MHGKVPLIFRGRPLVLAICLSVGLTILSGCVSDEDTARAITQFQKSSTVLTCAFQSLLVNANRIEENHFIDGQVFEGKPISPPDIQAHDILTDDQIKLRISAIKALSDYTSALAALAAGKPAAQIRADAEKASTSLSFLASDAATVSGNPAGTPNSLDFSGPVSGAVSAIGDVLELIERHRGEAAVRDSIRDNDPRITALFNLLSTESTELYERQKSTLSDTGVILFHDYDAARQASPVNSAELLQLGDRIKQFRADSNLLRNSNPATAIAAFKKAHDALVATILAPKGEKKQSVAGLIASVKSFAADVAPLDQKCL